MRSFFSSDPEAVTLNLQDGEQAIEIDTTIENPYVLNGALAERPENPATLNGTVIENIPVGTVLLFDQQYAITNGVRKPIHLLAISWTRCGRAGQRWKRC
jgi:hypothetical protein